MRYTIGIDAGTSSVKGLLLKETGECAGTALMEYTLDQGPEDRCEADPEIYWINTCLVIKKLLKDSGINPSMVSAISFSSQGETLIVIGKDGRPLRKAMVWLDNRSAAEAAEIAERFGIQKIMNVTGLPETVPIWPATKILWLKKNEPETFTEAHKFLMVEDYLIYRLTGLFVTEYSISSDTLYFDITKKNWWQEMLEFLGISSCQLPVALPSGEFAGKLTTEASIQTGLPESVLCITGSYDHPSAAIGSGSIRPGIMTISVGSSMAMCIPIEERITDLSLRLPVQCHSVNGLYFLLPYALTAGINLKWFRDEFLKEEYKANSSAARNTFDAMLQEAQFIPPGAGGLIMLPYLAGSGSPGFNPSARGSFTGFGLEMKRGHFIRAILEGVAYDINNNLEFLKGRNIVPEEIRLLGGASSGKLWAQIISDVTGVPVITMAQPESASLGAAILAGVGSGIFRNLQEACDICCKVNNTFVPDMNNNRAYSDAFRKYKLLDNLLNEYWTKGKPK